MMKQKTTGHRRIPSRLLGVSLLLAGMSLVPVSGPVWAREGATAATFGLVDEAPHTFLRPRQVSLFPTHALVQGEEELEIRVRDGVGRVELFVPENARNLQFDLGDVRLASWRSRVAPAAVADGDARRRQDLLARKRAVEGELEAVSARLGLWTAHAGERSLEALEKLDARMAEVIPRLRERQAALQRELKTISSVLASLPRVTQLHLLPYHRLGADKYAALGRDYPMGDAPLLTDAHMQMLLQTAQQSGLRCQIGG